MSVSLSRAGNVSVLHLGGDENRFTTDWLDAVEGALDEVVASAPTVLATIGEGKFYSNGLDVAELMAMPERVAAYAARVQQLLARLLTLPVPTIAAVNGHAFGAGAMFALAHDFRIMNAEKGFFCFPEVDIKIPFVPGMAALIQAKLTPAAAVEAMTTGRRYGGPDAATCGLVDQTAAGDKLLDVVAQRAQALHGKDTATLAAIKNVMFAGPAAALRS